MAIDPPTYFISWHLLQKKTLTMVMDMDSDFFQYMVWAVANVVLLLCVYIPTFYCLSLILPHSVAHSLCGCKKEKKDTFGRNSSPMWKFYVQEIVEYTKHLNKISLFFIQKTVASKEICNPLYHQSMFSCLYCYHNRSHLIFFKRHGCSTR